MGYKMKGSPANRGIIQGTSGHASAVKSSLTDALKNITLSGSGKDDTDPDKQSIIPMERKGADPSLDTGTDDFKPTKATKTAEEVKSEVKAEKAQSSKKTHRLRKKLEKQKAKSLEKGHKTKKQTRVEDRLAHSEKMDTDPEYRKQHKEMQRAKAADMIRSGFTDPDKLQSTTASQDALRKQRSVDARTNLAEKRLEHDQSVEARRGKQELPTGEKFVDKSDTGSEATGSGDVTKGESKYKIDWSKAWRESL